MTRRATTLAVALVVLAGLVVAARFITVPYVILLPGPVTDTLGTVPAADSLDGRAGGPVISISGARIQPASGHLYLTTVEELPGRCDTHPTLWEAVQAWFSSTQTVEPYQVECPPGQSSQQVQQQAEQQMSQSQVHAIVAAFTELGYHRTGNVVEVNGVQADAPAADVLRAGDVIDTADGTAIRTVAQLQHAVRSRPIGSTIRLTIRRGGRAMSVATRSFKGSGGVPLIGITPLVVPTFNGVVASIGIDPAVIGGPSAGTALALGLVDKLTPGGITGGRTIAGTGTVSATGRVGPIGGIQQKIAAAAQAHASVFFAPASECSDAKAAAPSSLTLVAIKTLHGAVQALKAIKSGSSAFPHC